MNRDKILTTAPLDMEAEIVKRRRTNRKRGNPVAWHKASKLFSLKKGYPLMIGGAGGTGKTELAFDIAINAACQFGWKFFVFSPETGDKYEIVEYILDKVSRGKHLEHEHENRLPDEDLTKLLVWINNHFRITDPSEHWDKDFKNLELNMDNLFAAVHGEEDRLGGKFDGVIIDTFNDLDIEPNSVVVKNNLGRMLAWTKKKDYFSIITNHVNDQQVIRQKVGGEYIIWTPPAKKEGWSYGQQFAKKGYQMILMYEEAEYHVDIRQDTDKLAEHSAQNNYNCRKILVQKSKPKGVGRTGACYLFYDRDLQRYYEYDPIMEQKRGILFPKI